MRAGSFPAEPRFVPAYSWRIWLGWIAITALLAGVVILVVVPTEGIKVDHIIVGLWFLWIPWTVGYFEFINSGIRRRLRVICIPGCRVSFRMIVGKRFSRCATTIRSVSLETN
jgi:hypothetical protein